MAALGGRTILSEFPELFGVEQQLINRGKSPEVGNRFIQLMRDYAARAAAVRAGFEMNCTATQPTVPKRRTPWLLQGRLAPDRRLRPRL